MQTMCVCVCEPGFMCARVYEHSVSRGALKALNTGKNEEMQFISFSDDATLLRLCKWQRVAGLLCRPMCGDLKPYLRILREI